MASIDKEIRPGVVVDDQFLPIATVIGEVNRVATFLDGDRGPNPKFRIGLGGGHSHMSQSSSGCSC
jgi:hypothetical protein